MGFLIVSIFWPKDKGIFSDLALNCCLSVGFGFGVSSCFVFVWMMVVGRATRGILVSELMLVVGLGALLAWKKRGSISTAADRPESVSRSWFHSPYVLRTAAGLAALSAAIRFWYLSRLDPHGQYDAFATWNVRARFLYGVGSTGRTSPRSLGLIQITLCCFQRRSLDHGSLSGARHN